VIVEAVSSHKTVEVQTSLHTHAQTAPAFQSHLVSAAEREQIWRTLYDESFDSIYRLVFSLGVPAEEIEDVVQRAFLVAYRRLQESESEVSHPHAWLRGIAVRVVSEHRRWRRVRRVKSWLLRATLDASTSERSTTPEDDAHLAQARQLVHKVLARMSPKLRDVLVLLELEECPVQEVATILQIPANTVRSRKRLARQEFERLWRRHVGEGELDG
jgi:RNA polymerase sigma-70 factor (ECF subfamily)